MLADYCYYYMFENCQSLTKAPALPATTLANSCYENMFFGCESLTELPALPATNLANSCYQRMFLDCSNICISDEAGTFDDITYSAEYRIPTTGEGTPASGALDDMFKHTGGYFRGTPYINTTYYVPVPAPAPAPAAKLILNVGENGKVVMDNGTFGNATVASNIIYIPAPLTITDGSEVVFDDGQTANLEEGRSINIATGGEVSFYPSADNTGEITAIPDEGYYCTGWYDGDELYSSGAALTYQNISEDITLTAKFAPKLFIGHSVTLGGDIGVNFYLNPAVINTYTGAKTVTFSWDGNETTVDVPATATADGYKVTRNVVAAQMAHKIKAEVYVGDDKIGQEYYSVQDYAEKVYNNPAKYVSGKSGQLKALAKAMLNYGAMAQTVFADSLTEAVDLPTDVVGVTDYNSVTAENIAAAIKGSASDLDAAAAAFDAEFYTSSLIYLSRNTLRLYFTPASKTVGALNGLDFSGNLSEYYYFKDVENIPAAELDNQQSFIVNGIEFTYSALDYAMAVVNSNNMSNAQKDLAKSLYLYNQAANAYFDPAAPAQNIVNLSALTAAYEAQDGDVLTGVLGGDYKITIAADATITLRDVTITCLSGNANFAGITPLGDATIILEGTNVVKGGFSGGYADYPGIFAPAGYTLTIDGTGSLTASKGDDDYGGGCGIGGGFQINAGNIEIKGGNITAIGGFYAAGIGGGECGGCGSITITGGTVNATGGYSGAGIGSGANSASCGNITIADTVTKVTATAGQDAASIGAGFGGSCGTISIADPSKVTQN